VITSPAPRSTFREVLAVREFRALWASQILSVGGDRLALVALTLLVYDRTRSPLLAAAAYAAGYVPWVIGGLLLSGLADRLPRREVMVACDTIRALLVTAMLVPRVPVAALVASGLARIRPRVWAFRPRVATLAPQPVLASQSVSFATPPGRFSPHPATFASQPASGVAESATSAVAS